MEKIIKKIAIIGAESTGKSDLCKRLATHYKTVFVPEYARTYFSNKDINNYTISDLEIIAQNQIESERKILKQANTFLFCDTTLLTIKIWADLEFNKAVTFVEDNLHKINYDYYLITNNDVPWEPDPLRQNKFSRDLIFKLNLDFIKKINANYFIVEGTNASRLKNAVGFIDKLLQ
ncbi:MAG: ATP-binding protein [Bacteroidota bacterium]|nr:ATP-binding protein [Bacteroidota bacterium]